ncbi:peptidase S8 [Arthrobacter sp. AFG7.2]|uniref:S8 family peptidase n=1 Tax=Arthrobacter sp. AFG7.2 TaxID=1688693 RepID=UPI000C9EB81B|nr:S8 family peptidase [Arthrobacter sp. AFG7.2]PNI09402.1 peptidase S8 [Arthrobacter sp. AFG7.2]
MKRHIVASFAAAIMSLGGLSMAAPVNAAPESPGTGHIIVKFKDGTAAPGLLRTQGLDQGEAIGSTGAVLVETPRGKEAQLVEELSSNPNVEYAEPDVVVTAAKDDPYFDRQYALHNAGQSFTNTAGTITVAAGTEDADVDAVEAWEITKGNGIKVAVIDSGVAIDHEDISHKVVARANFSDTVIDEPADYDRYGHGTHVAGIVAAEHNSTGVAGVCPGCTILDAKVLDDGGAGSSSAVAAGVDWAVAQGAKVINMSLGQRVPSRTLEVAIKNAWSEGVVIVAAAGNAGTEAEIYPAAYSKVIAVAATDNKDAKAPFSSYGEWVDVAAPGVDIYSTFPHHEFVAGIQGGRHKGYDLGSGTSMASPVVAGVAALVWSADDDATNESVREDLESTADHIKGTGTYWAHGRIDADKAVNGK